MKNLSKIVLLRFVLLSTLFQACQKEQTVDNSSLPKENILLGSWEMSSIHWIAADTTYSIEKAQPGLLMINADRYAIMWTPTGEPRVPFVLLSNPTDDELKSGFRSIVFNSGTYEMTDSTFTTTAKIAKVPGFEGGRQFYQYKIENNTLELVMYDETYPNGDKPLWFGKYTTKFILKKVE